jgi:hypothetical protein
MGQAARWLEFIEEYDFTIVHRSGISHGNCDALSRRPLDETSEMDDVQQESGNRCCKLIKPKASQPAVASELKSSLITAEQAEDFAIQPLLTVIRNKGQRPTWSDVQSSTEETRILWGQFASLRIQDNALCRKFHRANGAISHSQIVMPASLRQRFLEQLHGEGGNVATSHFGIRKTQAHVQQRAYWAGWRIDAEAFCRRCPLC